MLAHIDSTPPQRCLHFKLCDTEIYWAKFTPEELPRLVLVTLQRE